MRWSKLFIPTLRDIPAGVGVVSHQLLLRAGYIRQISPTSYARLFLAERSLQKLARIIRGEIGRIGGQEIHLPLVHPADRKLNLPSSLEAVMALAGGELRSYKQLPQIWYHMGLSFSEDPRPKAGLLQARQLQEEHSYSFAIDDAGLNDAYNQHLEAISKILNLCRIKYLIAEDANSHSFMLVSDVGDVAAVQCAGCGYVAKRGTARSCAIPPVVADPPGDHAPEPFHTPDRKTIADVADLTGLPATSQIKSLVYAADQKPVLAILRGDHSLNDVKLARVVGTTDLRPAYSDEIRRWFGTEAGSLGPVGVKNMRVIADEALRGRRNMIAGANRDDYHLLNVTPGEDFSAEYFDLRETVAGDTCVQCGALVEHTQCFEIAHARKVDLCELSVLDSSSAEVRLRMGLYGMRLERILCAAIELSHDRDGMMLPPSLAPFHVIITPVNVAEAALSAAAERIYQGCCEAGLDPLLDDRDERPGVKFKDADLIGVPFRITVGKKMAQGIVEVTERRTRISEDVAESQAVAVVAAKLRA